jgi:hypothetical protein
MEKIQMRDSSSDYIRDLHEKLLDIGAERIANMDASMKGPG